VSSELSDGPCFEKRAELGRGPELRDRIELFECRREGIGERPHGARRELFMLRVEVEVMHRPRQVLRDIQVRFG